MAAVVTTGRWAEQLLATGANAVALIRQAHALAGATVVLGGAERAVDVERLGLPPAATVLTIVVTGRQPLLPNQLAAGHVVIDTSSLAAAWTYDLLRQLLDMEHDGRFRGEIQVLVDGGVASDPDGEDGAAVGDGAGPGAHPLGVWVPVLYEGAGPELSRLFHRLQPHEVCPVLPFPSRNARRADELVLEHRDLLFGEMRIDLRNVVYAHESDPSDLYRALAGMHRRLHAHGPAAPPTMAVTPGDGRLLALGAFLASYDCGIPVVWRRGGAWGERSEGADLTCVWVAGAPYRTAP